MLKSLLGNYWIVNQILSKNLHNSNDECMTYTVHIMDKLEKVCETARTLWRPKLSSL